MKAAELLRLYEAGRRDFSGESLRGENFKGKDLSGADFSGADIRSANFTNANLTRTNFNQAKAGLQKRWVIALVGISFLLSGLSGFLSAFAGYFVALIFDSSSLDKQVAGWVSLAVIVVFLLLLLRKGVVAGSVALALALAGSGAVAVAEAVAGAVAGAGPVVVALTLAVAVALALAGSVAVAVAVARALALALAEAGSVAVAVAGSGALVVAVALAGSVAEAEAVAVAVAVAMTLISAYIGWRALKGDQRDAWIRSVAIAFAVLGGTSFRGATLTDADFSQACLKGSDFRRSVLLRTRWRDAIKLDRVRPGETYLHKPKIRELVLTGNGQGQAYDHLLNLAGINLQGANLVKADFSGSILKDGNLQGADLTNARFIGANCNGINLQDADLSGSKLVQTQLDEADLTGTTLTGAYIEDWNITTKTRLDGIHCDYVFMRLPPEDDLNSDPHRKPDDKQKTFADGEFSDFIAPMVKTLDLYHNQVLDTRALAIAFHELRENNPDADLEIVSMEKRGKQRDQLLVRAEASQQSDLSALHRQYFERYDYLLTLPPQAMQALLIEKDREVRRLAGLVGTAITQPKTQINKTYQGDTTVSEQSSNASKYDMRGTQFAGGFAETVQGNMEGGTIHNQATETPSLTEAAAEIQALLKQLEQTAPAETTTQKMTLATQAIAQIEANPTFKQRTVAALTAGGIKAFEAAIDHPVAAFVVGAIEEWQKS